MKIKLFSLFLMLTISIGTTFASTKIGDLYYNLNNRPLEIVQLGNASYLKYDIEEDTESEE